MASTPLTVGGEHHITPVSTYVKTILALVVLMALTVYVAVYLPVPDFYIGSFLVAGVWINNLIALTIAVMKALLVIMFFMGVKYSSSLTKLWTVAGFLTLAVMFFIFGDYTTRQYEPAASWTGTEPSALPRVLNPRDEKLPPEEDINVRPRE
jgi:cytochrome c oxidase subunit 4